MSYLDEEAPRTEGMDATPLVVEVGDARAVDPPQAPVTPMSDLQRAGIGLAEKVLGLIAAIAFILLVMIGVSELYRPPPEVEVLRSLAEHAERQYIAASSPEMLKAANEVLEHMDAARRAARDHWMAVTQLLLLNLLLPVLTSILGYIFGIARSERSN